MQFDLAIIGGGMVGAALAVSLKNTDLQIVLIDALPEGLSDDRLIALNDSSVCLFESNGIWPTLQTHAAPIEQIHVSHRGRFGITRIDCKELNSLALGYVVPAKYINAALYSTLENANNIKLIRPAKLQHLTQTDDAVTLEISTVTGEQVINAALLIGADGSFSTVRDLVGIDTDKTDYQQSALVTTTILQRGHKNIAYERFQSEGAIAMLPLTGNRAATIWTSSNETIARLTELSDRDFINELQSHFGYRLGRFLNIEKRSTYPLQMVRAKQQCKKNVLLIGNAAHTFHPIASQGLNLALYEVRNLVKYFQQPMSKLTFKHLPMDALQERFSKNLSHHLTWIFSSDYFMLNVVRQASMLGLDVLPGLKKRFAFRAMGKTRIS
jgi:2-octaprenyl-6-methoxyphenol hydroxylase